ncbi:MAG: nucleotide-binding protein [Bacillota bacterium]
MNPCAIVTRDTVRQVAAALRDRGMADASVRITERGQGPAAMEEVSRIPAELLILDVATGPGLGPAALRYRLARPEARVLLLAPGRIPGDVEVAGVVQSGVYDVVTDLDDLGAILDRPQADLSVAALWLDPRLQPQDSAREQGHERVVERRVAVSQRPVLIAVAGVSSGVGVTTVVCTLAGYLARQGHRTVMVEGDGQPSLGFITDMDLDHHPRRWLPDLDVCIEPAPRNLVRARQHAYVVVDLGAIPPAELVRIDADLILVVLPQAHRILRSVDWLKACNLQAGEPCCLRYVVIGERKAAGKAANIWKEICMEMAANMLGSLYWLPVSGDGLTRWPPGYRKRSEEMDRSCEQVLAEVLPDSSNRRGRLWYLFRGNRGSRSGSVTPGSTPASTGTPKE